MSNKFDGKVVVVTGAASGMGKSMVEEFSAAGARVAALDINEAKAKEVAAQADDSARVLAVGVDVSAEESVNAAVEQVRRWAGRVDILCNNAGIIDSFRPAHEIALEEWHRNIAVNLTGPFLMARAVIPTMLEQRKGAIINTASISSLSAAGGGTAYTAAKHGVLGLTRQLTFDYGKLGIRVNAICPGATLTGLTMPEGGSETLPDSDSEILRTPAQRWCRPEEIARLAVYLAGDDADFIHGAAMVIDGGWLTAARNPI
ncbi:putative oxidoreductase [Gordonia polyisoprenivorans NBRC 16320 = JCM 10675]|uniref:Glucose 1-dehydrogenase n=1 Tax=Gordonia polyisoprenivorans TaxID=84595 RepID=A0A846WU57_9ACTN|nr:glucose 1-dehydrogenase [Gordonia polyisoprenivorans]NKY03911.1 glucose 1-dehydrogenase [Gordonia polyisoprenivorans]GAB24222.1 putative oxidoreductase [Gordonia polyisoprenivorans NBRC 16320 = JCM 10675]